MRSGCRKVQGEQADKCARVGREEECTISDRPELGELTSHAHTYIQPLSRNAVPKTVCCHTTATTPTTDCMLSYDNDNLYTPVLAYLVVGYLLFLQEQIKDHHHQYASQEVCSKPGQPGVCSVDERKAKSHCPRCHAAERVTSEAPSACACHHLQKSCHQFLRSRLLKSSTPW